MKMRLMWLVAVFALGTSMALTGCELQESCDPATDPDCVVADAASDTTTGGDMGTSDTTTEGQSYHYVLIEDREPAGSSSQTHTAGADIFGVQLVKNGTTFNASDYHVCNFGGGDNAHATDCTQALGTPVGDCSTSRTADYVALGGEGGQLIVSFGQLEEILSGNEIKVYECGAEHNPGALEEHYDAYVGVSTSPSASTWVECVRGGTGESTCTVGTLPFVPRN